MVVFEATEISGLSTPTYPSAAANKQYVDSNISSYWTSSSSGIYHEGEVTIGSPYDYGEYALQVGGDAYFSGSITFKGNQISGIAAPSYPSSIANKQYVDTVSSNIISWANAEFLNQDSADALYSPTGALVQDDADSLYAPSGVDYLTEDEADNLYAPSGVDYLTQDEADNLYEPSGMGYITQDTADGLYSPTGALIQDTADSLYSPSGDISWAYTNLDGRYYTEDEADGLFAPSTNYLTQDEADNLYSPTGSLMQDTADGLYHPSGYGYFSYISAQTISGGVITTDSITIDANTISGLAAPTYNSGAANKKYVDDISGAIITHADGTYHPSGEIGSAITWGQLIDGNGIQDFTVVVSGAGATIQVDTDYLDGVYAPTGAIGGLTQDEADALYEPSGMGYVTQDTTDSLYYPSSLGNIISGSVYTHIDDASIHTELDTLDARFAPSGVDYLTEDEADALYEPSGLGYITQDTADGLYAPTGVTSGYWQSSSGLYYDGEVRIGPYDYGAYNFQVSGDAYFSGQVTFLGELSGLAEPTYNSGAANKIYVDNVSSSIVTWAGSEFLTSDGADALYAPTGAGGITQDEADALYSPTGALTQDTADSLYYPSSLGNIISGSLYTHIDDATIHFTVDSIDDNYAPSGDISWAYTTLDGRYYTEDEADGLFQPSGTSGITQDEADALYSPTGALVQDSADALYHPSGYGYFSYISSTTISGGTVTTGDLTLNANVISGLIDPPYPSAAATKHYVDTVSSNIITWAGNEFLTSDAADALYHPSGEIGSAITWGQLIDGNGIQDFTVVVSGAGATVQVDTDYLDAVYAQTGNYLTQDEADALYTPTGATGGESYLSSMTDANISSPGSGQVLMFDGNSWDNKYPPMTFSVANVYMSSNTNLNLARFNTGADKKCYVWSAYACGSGGTSLADLKVEILSGSTSLYSTSSATIQQGSPLAVSLANSPIEIRFAYSGSNVEKFKYGTAMMQVSVY